MTRQNRQPARPTALALRPTQPAALLLALLLLLSLAALAAGCGATDGERVAPASAHDAHQAWVDAIRAGDGDATLALTDPELPERAAFARDAVSRMQEYLTSPASPTGALERVTVDPVVDGVGRSVWQFALKRWCYRAELIDRGERWYVSRWGQTSVDCQ